MKNKLLIKFKEQNSILLKKKKNYTKCQKALLNPSTPKGPNKKASKKNHTRISVVTYPSPSFLSLLKSLTQTKGPKPPKRPLSFSS